MTKRGRAFSGGEDDYSRIVGADFSGAGCMGDEATSQRFRVYLRVTLHISLVCYLTTEIIETFNTSTLGLLLQDANSL
jgi:hypothetical protein